MRRPKEVETNLYDTVQAEVLNDKALMVVNRVEQKLTGQSIINSGTILFFSCSKILSHDSGSTCV